MQRHDEDLDQLEAAHATNQANLREKFETELSRVREDHHSELSRLKEERDQEKADIQARYRKEEEKAYQEKMSVRQERDRALQDISRLEDEAKAAENLNIEIENLKRQIHELKNDSANKDLKITQLHKEREKDRADVDGLNMALESKQQELELVGSFLFVQHECLTSFFSDQTENRRRRDCRRNARTSHCNSSTTAPSIEHGHSPLASTLCSF